MKTTEDAEDTEEIRFSDPGLPGEESAACNVSRMQVRRYARDSNW